ncbi:MaoC/PaaZ C-terminal domain-containing protein [Demequina activiva]|uniref:MaoC-like domain-containing protein n=1 Tax=Demequina activiva TaxID=1582364 RepID=A0A919Q657_9MICO|nr:MaoC/PaaZ C-terminal domain-containing protein [Demequina activiva]GIG54530.1 hypothetical protein Dac01nite_12820 [Demequina activiva]
MSVPPAAGAADRPVQHLDAMPGMAAAFARALAPSRRDEARLPRHAVQVSGYRQDPARLAEYSRVCGFTLRDHVPPTWLHVLTFPLHVHVLGDRSSTVRLAGAVHVSNSMTLHRPVGVQESLDIAVHAQNLRPHRRGALVDLVGTITVAGDVVWEGVSTYLASGMSTPGEPEEAERPPWEPLVPHATWRLPGDLGRRYRRVSHDPNPIHTSRIAAKAFGFARPIIHGMWTHARALAALENRLPASYRVHVDFLKPILLPGPVGFASTAREHAIDATVTSRDGSRPLLRLQVTEAP